ncbi:PTS system mannose/fructose/sorbose family transporter subunit IID [Lactococcus hircilactis]
MAEKIKLTKNDRLKVNVRSWWLLGSYNYERMQNIGIAFSLIPAIKKLYPKKRRSSRSFETPFGILQHSPLRCCTYFRSNDGA